MTAALHGWARTALRTRSVPCAYADLPDIVVDAHGRGAPALVSMRWFPDPADRDAWMHGGASGQGRAALPHRYWWWLDIDAPMAGDGPDDAAAYDEGSALWRWELEEACGMLPGRDFVPMVSGGKGIKIASATLTPLGVGWDAVFGRWARTLSGRHGGLVDVAMAGQDVTRVPGCPHLSRHGRWQTPIPAPMRGAGPDDMRALARIRPHPSEPVPFRDLVIPPTLSLFPDPSAEPSAATLRLVRTLRADHVIEGLFDGLPSERRPRGRAKAVTDWGPPLERAGLLRRTFESGGRTLWRLVRCPVCGEAEGNPFVTGAGRLYDRRTSCPALYEPGADGAKGSGGLPASAWARRAGVVLPAGAVGASGRRDGPTPVARARAASTAVPPDEAERRLTAIIARSMADGRRDSIRVVRCTPGVGKTEAALRGVAATAGVVPIERTLLGVESHELASEMVVRLRRMLPPMTGGQSRVAHLTGRDGRNCDYIEACALLGARGWEPGRHFCPRCPSREGCWYYRSLLAARDVQFVVTTWEQALSVLESETCGAFHHLILDEDPLRALTLEIHVGMDDLSILRGDSGEGGLGEPSLRLSAQLLLDVMGIATDRAIRPGRPGARRPEAMHLRGAALHALVEAAFVRMADATADHGMRRWADAGAMLVAARAASDRIELAPGFFAPRRREDGRGYEGGDVEAIRRFPARTTLQAISAIARDHRRWQARGGADMLGRSVLTASRGAAPVIDAILLRRPGRILPHVILDAYADRTLYEAAWGCPIDIEDIEVAMPTATFLRIPVPTSRAAFADPARAGRAWEALDDALRMLRAAGHTRIRGATDGPDNGRRILVVTHKPLAARVRERHPDVDVRHYGEGRGVDLHRDKTAAVAFGEPEIPPEASIRLAQLLFGDDDIPLNEDRSDDHIRLWADPRIQAAVDSRREAEMAQAVHRIRPVMAPVDPRRAAQPGVPLHMFDVPPGLKAVVTIGMLDSHLLPPPVDAGAGCVRLAEGHVALLRECGATAAFLTMHMAGWWTGPGWRPSRRHYARSRAALALAAAVTGAVDRAFAPPAGLRERRERIQEWERIRAHERIVWSEAVGIWITEEVPEERRLVREYDRPLPPLRWPGLGMPGDRRIRADPEIDAILAPLSLETALVDISRAKTPAAAMARLDALRTGLRSTRTPRTDEGLPILPGAVTSRDHAACQA